MLVHRCRFVEAIPAAVQAMALANNELLAVARSNGSIELYNTAQGFLQIDVFWTEASGIRKIEFLKHPVKGKRPVHMITAGLDGYIRVFYLPTHQLVASWNAGGSAIWDLTVLPEDESKSSDNVLANSTCVAVSCDDGTVRVVLIRKTEEVSILDMAGMLPPQINLIGANQRLVSIGSGKSIDNLTRWIWAGSASGQLFRWDITFNDKIDSGISATTSPTMTVEIGKRVVPWSVKIVPDSTSGHILFVGDSEGKLTIWDGAFGTRIQQLQHHMADILQIASDSQCNTIFCSGVDNSITSYERNSGKGGTSWIFVAQVRPHTHDVLSLVTSDTQLFSGGIDTRVFVSELADRLKLPGRPLLPWNQRPIASLITRSSYDDMSSQVGAGGRMLVRLNDSLQVWRLGKAIVLPEEVPSNYRQPYAHDILEEHSLLLELRPKLLEGQAIEHSKISSDGNVVAMSDSISTKIFSLAASYGAPIEPANPMDGLLEVKHKFVIEGPSTRLAFSKLGYLIRATTAKTIEIYDVKTLPTLVHTFDRHVTQQTSQKVLHTTGTLIQSLVVSFDGKWLASADGANNINIFNLETLKLHSTTPQFDAPHTALTFDREAKTLVVATTANQLCLWDVAQQRLNKTIGLSKKGSGANVANNVVGLVFSPKAPGQLLVYGHSFMAIYNTTDTKAKRKPVSSFQSLLFADFLEDGTLVAMERPWQKVLPHLPPSFHKKRFGT